MVRRAAFTTRSLLGVRPTTFRPLAAFEHRRSPAAQGVISAETRLVVDGFQGSANSYTVVAVRRAQPVGFPIAHHLHAPAAICMALGRGIPHILLIRPPFDACASNLRRFPHLGSAQVVRGWIRYYGALLDLRAELVVADFAEVVADLNGVIDRVNERHTDALDRLSLDEDELVALRPDPATDVSRLNDGVEESRSQLTGRRVERLLDQANLIYRQFQA